MKKLITTLLTSIILISTIILPVSADDNIKVLLDGQELSFDVPPQIINDRTMVPMRTIFETLGYGVVWDQEEQTIYAIRQPQYIMMSIDETKYFDFTLSDMTDYPSLNDILPERTKELDVPPQIVDGRTLVPLRAVSEMSGCDVQWDAPNRTVIISTGSAGISEPQDSFVKLKNVIVGSGGHGAIPDSYVIHSSHNTSDFLIELSYVGDAINMTFVGKQDQNKATITLLLYEEGSNVLSTTFNYNNGATENLVGYYDTQANEFSKISGSISISEDVLNYLWDTIFAAFDSTIMEYTSEIMLSDFGINYYTDDNNSDRNSDEYVAEQKEISVEKAITIAKKAAYDKYGYNEDILALNKLSDEFTYYWISLGIQYGDDYDDFDEVCTVNVRKNDGAVISILP